MRHLIRMQSYDYSLPGAYFITICSQNQQCLFGKIINGEMVLNNGGKIIRDWWLELEQKFPNIQLDQYIVMPNHIHGIIIISETTINTVGADLCVCPYKKSKEGEHTGSPLHKTLQWFKTMTTNEYIYNVKHEKWKPFYKRL